MLATEGLRPMQWMERVAGTSVMAKLVRGHDWRATGLGPIEEWSEALVSQLNFMLHLPYAANLSWGEDLIYFYNDAAIEAVGFRHPTALGRSASVVFADVWEQIGPDFEDCLRCGRAPKKENVFVPSRQWDVVEDRYWNYFLTPAYEGERVAGVLQIFQDRTEAVLSKLRLVREQADLMALFEQAPVAMTVLEGAEHRYTMANPAYEAMFGNRQYVGRCLADVLPEAVEQGFVSMLDEVYRSGRAFSANNARFTLALIAGEEAEDVYIDFICAPRRNIDGEVCGIVTMAIDVTDRRRVTHALIESEKVAAVGRLASSIAHEINNPLSTAMNYLYLVETTENIEEIRGYLAVAERELKRVSAISSQTLLSQKRAMELSSITFEDLAESTLALYRGVMRTANIVVETRYRPQQLMRCVEGELRQVISNLISNSVDAMRTDGGRLLIRACEGCDWLAGHKVHKLTIADTGMGMTAKEIKEIFKPFFTTKGFSGNGLGLWVSREIVMRYEGRIAVRSRKGSGSVFTLYLPSVKVEG